MLFREYINQIVKKSVNTVTYHSSKFYFLKFFFERNNKQKNLEIKKNYIFSNSKWTNYYSASLSPNHIFLYLKYALMVWLLVYFFWICVFHQKSFSVFVFLCYSSFHLLLQKLAILVYVTYNTCLYFITRQQFDVKEVLDKLDKESLRVDKDKDVNLHPSTLSYLPTLNRLQNQPILPNYSWTFNMRYTCPEPKIKSLTEIEFEALNSFKGDHKLFTSNVSKVNSFKYNFLTLTNFNLNGLNFKNILNLAKEDRWLIKSSLIDNNAFFQLNLRHHYYSRFNTYFTSNAWLLKKYYFFNQLRYNNYNTLSYINKSATKSYDYLTLNLFNLNLKFSLSDLNSIYLAPNDSNSSTVDSALTNTNLSLVTNNLDLFIEENLFFFSKMTANMNNSSSLLFYPLTKGNNKVSTKVDFKF